MLMVSMIIPSYFLGFRKKDVKQFVSEYAARKNKPYQYIAAIGSMGDFASIVTNSEEGTVLLISCAGINSSQETLRGITDAIEDGFISILVGNGEYAQQINMDIPKLNYIFSILQFYVFPEHCEMG